MNDHLFILLPAPIFIASFLAYIIIVICKKLEVVIVYYDAIPHPIRGRMLRYLLRASTNLEEVELEGNRSHDRDE